MTPKEYIDFARLTDHDEEGSAEMADRAFAGAPMLHYVLGMCTEVGEIQDIAKKALAYGKPVDVVNLKEELGDVLWYIARINDLYGFTFEQLMETNINKLKARYGEKFTKEAALNRNLEKERQVLEDDEEII